MNINDSKNPNMKFLKNCNDCGRFVKKGYWIDIGKKPHDRPLCGKCRAMYDDPLFL